MQINDLLKSPVTYGINLASGLPRGKNASVWITSDFRLSAGFAREQRNRYALKRETGLFEVF
jgi:hypothetical protein